MQYSKYLGALVRNNGVPNLSTLAFQQLMNIVHLEGQIEGVKKAKKLNQEDELYKYDMIIFNIGKSLTEITGNLPPADFVRQVMMRKG